MPFLLGVEQHNSGGDGTLSSLLSDNVSLIALMTLPAEKPMLTWASELTSNSSSSMAPRGFSSESSVSFHSMCSVPYLGYGTYRCFWKHELRSDRTHTHTRRVSTSSHAGEPLPHILHSLQVGFPWLAGACNYNDTLLLLRLGPVVVSLASSGH